MESDKIYEVTLIHWSDPRYHIDKHLCNTCIKRCKYFCHFKVSQCSDYQEKKLWKFHGWCGNIILKDVK
jgi:hypothetical protein